MGDRQQRSLWLDIPHGSVHRSDPAAGSDDVFGAGKPVGVVGMRSGKIKVSGSLSDRLFILAPGRPPSLELPA
jgi:sugar lactone lactonase YvrE